MRRHARWLVASVALVVGSLAVTQLVLDRREDARVAALAADPGRRAAGRTRHRRALAGRPGARDRDPGRRGGRRAAGRRRRRTRRATSVIVGLDPDTGRGRVAHARRPADRPAAPGRAASPAAVDRLQRRPARTASAASPPASPSSTARTSSGCPTSTVWVLDPADGDAAGRPRGRRRRRGLTFVDDALVVAHPGRRRRCAGPHDASAVRWEVTRDRRRQRRAAVDLDDAARRRARPRGRTGGRERHGRRDAAVVRATTSSSASTPTPGSSTTDGEPRARRRRSSPARGSSRRARGVFVESTWTSSRRTAARSCSPTAAGPHRRDRGLARRRRRLRARRRPHGRRRPPGGADGLSGRVGDDRRACSGTCRRPS